MSDTVTDEGTNTEDTMVRTGFMASHSALADALAVVGRMAATRPGVNPVMGGVRFSVTGNQLNLAATDLDMSASVTMDVLGAGDGKAVLPAKLVAEVVRSMDGEVRFNFDGGSGGGTDEVNIAAGRSSFNLRSLPCDEFPTITTPEGSAVTVEVAGFRAALAQVLVAAGVDDGRPILTGVLVSAEGEGLRLVATDSYRLAVRDLAGDSDLVHGRASLLVPARALSELLRILPTSTGDLTVYTGVHDIAFVIGNVTITSRLIEGEYPNYRGLIPDPLPPNTLTMAKAPLIESLKRVKLLARDTTTPVRMNLESGSLFDMKVISMDVGQASEEVDASYSGAPMQVGFNPTFLLQGVEAVSGDTVVLRLTDSLKPAILSGEDTPEFQMLLMPIRVGV